MRVCSLGKACEGEQSRMKRRKETCKDMAQVKHSLGLTQKGRDLRHEPHHKIPPPFFNTRGSTFHSLHPSSLAVAALSVPVNHVSEKGASFELSAVQVHSSKVMGIPGQYGDTDSLRLSPVTAKGRMEKPRSGWQATQS